MFRARLPSIFITSHKRHACQGICTLSPLHAAMRFAKTRNATSKVLPLPREMTLEVSKVLRPKTAAHLLKMARKICAWHTSRVSTRHDARGNVTKRQGCHANEGTRCLEAPKVTTGHRYACHAMFCKARYRPSRGHARTAANGCATSGKHSFNPQTTRVKREPLLRIREKCEQMHSYYSKLHYIPA